MKRCVKCVLPANYPGIEFNDEGICNYCLTCRKATYKGEDQLKRFLAPFRNGEGKYDCLVGISGGRDSSYALYYLAKKCDLRVLAYTADNGFVPEDSKTNMRKITERLGVELVTEKYSLLKKSIGNNVSSWLRKSSPGMVPMICCGCRLGVFRGLLRYAKRNRIPLIALGTGTPIEASRFKELFLTENPLGRLAGVLGSGALSLLSGLIYEMVRNPAYLLSPMDTLMFVQEYLYFLHFRTTGRLFYPNQKILYLFEYIEWDEDKVLSTIENELGWTKPAGSASSWRSDCRVSFLKNYLLKKTVGFTEKDDMLSNMIREGIVTREEALKRLESENVIPQKFITELLDEIGIKDKPDVELAADTS